ncbi:hypothetical protein D081_1926 [Anaerovibrio sp. JC8]|nr:hypothetical protein D081_1926 [Anaerovibrio sp. JC8]
MPALFSDFPFFNASCLAYKYLITHIVLKSATYTAEKYHKTNNRVDNTRFSVDNPRIHVDITKKHVDNPINLVDNLLINC